MTTGESLFEEETDELDEDYLDPSYLHAAAELYDNPDLYYEMQSKLESAHGHTHSHTPPRGPSGMRGYHFEDESDYYCAGASGEYVSRARGFTDLRSGPGQQHLHWNEDDADENALSPGQYALLMQSMQEPLAMYASTLDSSYRDDALDLEGYDEGPNFSMSMPIVRRLHPGSPNNPQGFTTMSGSRLNQMASAGRVLTTAAAVGGGDSQTLLAEHNNMMLYSPGGRFNPSPTFTYPPPNLRTPNERGAGTQTRSPVPLPSQKGSSTGEGAGAVGGGYRDLHPASLMSATYPGAAGGVTQTAYMPAPPPSRNKPYRPATRQGF